MDIISKRAAPDSPIVGNSATVGYCRHRHAELGNQMRTYIIISLQGKNQLGFPLICSLFRLLSKIQESCDLFFRVFHFLCKIQESCHLFSHSCLFITVETAAMDSSLRSGGGRRRIPIVKIEKKEARRVTFSKRRQGLFKKASDLSVLCGVDVAVVALSAAGNPYCYASTPSLIRRIFSASPPTSPSSSSSDIVDELWRAEKPIERMSLDELRVFREQLAREMRSIEAEGEGSSRSCP